MLSTTGSIFSDMQRIADKIKWDVESQLNEAFRTFDVIEDLTPKMQDEKNTYCRMRIRTDDNGHVKVKTMQKDPGSDWKVEVEEYDRGNKPIEAGKESNLALGPESFFKDMQSMSKRLKRDVEKQLKRAFRTFDVLENRLKIKTDNNGEVNVKAMQDKPNSELEVQVQDYEKGKQLGEQKVQKKKPFLTESEPLFQDLQSMADKIQKRVEQQLNEAFKTFEVIENRLKIKTDDNGQVQVKASQNEAGTEAKVEVEEVKRGEAPSQGKEPAQQRTVEV